MKIEMKNEIEKIRKEITEHLDFNNKEVEEEYEISKTGDYHLTVQYFRQSDNKRNWVVSKIEIWKAGNPTFDFEFIANSDTIISHYRWMIKDGIEYLFCVEATGGQSVYDTKNKKLYSFYNEEEPFIWVKLYPSPDGNKLAVEGCYWACPTELRIYNISEITALPYPIIHHETSFDDNCEVERWQSNHQLIFWRNKNEKSVIAL